MSKFYIVICFLFLFTSCSDWLDIKPDSEVVEEDMFESESGYKDALVGVYSLMSARGVYGGNLTMGTLDVLAQNYNVRFSPSLTDLAKFDYVQELPEGRINQIWGDMYNVIANCNTIIEHIELMSKESFTEDNYNLIYAEALGLRAYVHFDLLRMFNAPYVSNPDYVGIPYVTIFSKEVSKQLSSKETIAHINADLSKAITLLEGIDPILIDDDENHSSNPFLIDRHNRMNLYAIKALMARVSLYVGDKEMALSYAKEVIDSEHYTFINPGNIINNKDYAFNNEHIFSIYTYKLKDNSDYYFSPKGNDQLFISSPVEKMFTSDDVRFKYWLTQKKDIYEINRYFMTKYERPEKEEEAEEYSDPNVPLIKISEMYLIAAECLSETNTAEALTYLNKLKSERVSPVVENVANSAELLEMIKKEYHLEFLSEGQTFFMYKRLALDRMTNFSGAIIAMDESKYIFPLPKDEIQFGGRK
ncbi:RagB/SusD family nutrient uptake outer membrane protein [Marinifilum fragile]|uniref:RagB/SusD family nutrient uptake outer membrane protein n=1 Tax=Marinifilum fragile TaxID=570161 RepID=UPI002AA687B9|nr:RagB/SusD family nutrient uptake outer membrane protein [Marinifilum fragile]